MCQGKDYLFQGSFKEEGTRSKDTLLKLGTYFCSFFRDLENCIQTSRFLIINPKILSSLLYIIII